MNIVIFFILLFVEEKSFSADLEFKEAGRGPQVEARSILFLVVREVDLCGFFTIAN